MSRPETSDAFITTWTGRRFHFLEPKAAEVCIQDVAYALSNTTRWGGHCDPPITVAQHSCMVAVMLRDRGMNAVTQLQGLLHDAAEAYIPDIPRPIKPFLTNFKEIEEYIERAVFEAFDVPYPLDKLVKYMDIESYKWEARDLMVGTGIEDPLGPRPHLTVWNPKEARERFFDFFLDLQAERSRPKENAA